LTDLPTGSVGRTKKFGSLSGESPDDTKVILLKPQQWMNLSGRGGDGGDFMLPHRPDVGMMTRIELGTIRIGPGGSSGGHNGLRDIIMRLGTDQFAAACRYRLEGSGTCGILF
jgi:peptidyl-tRNA hydrolase